MALPFLLGLVQQRTQSGVWDGAALSGVVINATHRCKLSHIAVPPLLCWQVPPASLVGTTHGQLSSVPGTRAGTWLKHHATWRFYQRKAFVTGG